MAQWCSRLPCRVIDLRIESQLRDVIFFFFSPLLVVFSFGFFPIYFLFLIYFLSIFLSLNAGRGLARRLFVFLIVFSFVRSSAGSQLLVPVDWSRGSHGYSRGGTLLQLHP